MIIGSHVKMAAPEYLLGSVKEALSYGANALMVYTGAPQNTKRKPVEELRIAEAGLLLSDHGIPLSSLIVHAPYLINPANSVNEAVMDLAVDFLNEEVRRTSAIGASSLVLHPGSHTVTDLKTGIRTAVNQLNRLDPIPDGICICLETMAGKGSEIGFQFEQIAELLAGLKQADHYAVCLDTCHVHDAGYDVDDFDLLLNVFDRIIGLDRLRVIHLNDSKNERGARKDRHANIGEGIIGFERLYRIAHHPAVEKIPLILETPYIDGNPPYRKEIAALRSPLK